jgi:hypothetical protein
MATEQGEMPGEIQPVYLPHNEPYLGDTELLAFDKMIPMAMSVNTVIAARTFDRHLSPLQIAATEIIPQGVSIALSIRELIRQAYLYSAAILVRPLIDRAGTISWLRDKPESVTAWQNGWPRRDQPSIEELISHMHPNADNGFKKEFSRMLHKHVHSDPEGSAYNMFERDGALIFPSGKIIDQPDVVAYLSSMGRTYLEKLISTAIDIFPS